MNGFGGSAAIRRRFGVAAIVPAMAGMVLLGPAQAAERPAAPVRVATTATRSGTLAGVSCISAHACMAVGGSVSSGRSERGYPLAESWNGKRWNVIPIPNPKGSTDTYLYSVSCRSANSCMAVGGRDVVHGGVPLAEAWNGKTWKIKATPKPDNDSALGSVSCGSANACVATGFAIQNNSNNWFSETWNGKTWKITTAPRPNGTSYSSLEGLSCTSGSVCIAAGSYQVNSSAKSRTLAERWNGRTWTINSTPNPRDGASGSELSDVSCSSAVACVAVGGYAKPSNRGGLDFAEIWNGRTWKISAIRTGRRVTDDLQGVSCPSAAACMAVGDYVTDSGSEVLPVAEAWNAGTWKIKTIPTSVGTTDVALPSVSCASVHICMATGEYQAGTFAAEMPLAEAWNGKSWTIKPARL